MSETKKRIKAYKEALPGLRDRVFAVAVLLLMSMVIITVSSFAWFTLSRAPKVEGISTQITGNGNLEIALSGSDGVTPPNASAVGDSSSTENQTIANSNLTWGNLINLADPAYGLEKVILRPAVLNNGKLGTEPFRSVVYGEDGRVTNDQNTKFSYCTWEPANDEIKTPHFGVSGKYGVRAIATVTERFEAELGGTTENMVKYYGYLDAAETENTKVQGIYPDELLKDTDAINALATIMGYYMQARVNTDADLKNPECTDQIADLSKLYNLFLRAMQQELNAMVTLANVQQFVYTKSDSYLLYTADTLRGATVAELTAKGIRLKNFTSFMNDLETVEADAALVASLAKDVQEIGAQVYTTDVMPVIERLVTVGSSVVVKPDGTTTTISAIGGIQAALDIIGDDPTPIIIQDGILARFEQRAGTYVNTRTAFPKGVEVTVKAKREIMGVPMTVPATVNVHITTQYYMSPPSLFAEDVEWTQDTFEASGMANGRKILTAGDTYGLAVDFWVRTNAGDPETGKSYLVLEGEVLYEQDTGTNANEESVGLLYYYTVENEETGEKTTYYVYQTEDGKWYEDYKHHGTNNEVTAATLAGKQMKEAYKDAPIGYEGENRVWEEIQQAILQPPLSEYNTTQGNGSCYTFYADSPQDQQKILNLLKHMYVVFTNGGDDYLATARFDTDENHYYEVGGKVTVPLVIMDSTYSYSNELNETVMAVAELQQNEATRITALVYLDGRELTNKEALAASDIQGTLNIQFGNSIDLTTIGDENLQQQERIVTATVKTENADNKLDYYTNNLDATVTVTVEGDQPATVTAFFQREINAFQGSRQQTMTFRQEGGNWICDDFVFPAPGKYVLRSVMLDGVEYELREKQEVTVEGVELSTLDVSRNGQLLLTRDNTIMIADNSLTLDLAATINTDDAAKMPKTVVVEIVRPEDGSSISVDMSPTTTGWTGTANIATSGYYEMAYVLLDGVRYDLGNLGKTFNLYLGLSAVVEAMPGTPQIVPLENNQGRTLSVRARIVDNSGNALKDLTDFHLFYKGEATGEELEAADIEWNAETGYYEANLHVNKADIYKFHRVETQGNTIYACESGVVFYVSKNTPVSYEGCDNSGNIQVIMPNPETGLITETAQLLIRLRNSAGAQIKAYFTNGENTYWVTNDQEDPLIQANPEVDGVITWKVTIPSVNGRQTGNWRMTKLELGNVTDSNGRYYPADNPLIINLAEQTGGEPTYTVIDTITADLHYEGETDFADLEFMQAGTVRGMSVDLNFKDATGNTVQAGRKISNVQLHYKHQSDSEAMGGYSIGTTLDEIVVDMTDSGNGTRFNQSADVTLRVAGTYKLTAITYKLEGDVVESRDAPVPESGNGTRFTVKSVKPEVKIQAVNPNGTKAAAYWDTYRFKTKNQTSGKISDYTATVYNQSTVSWGRFTITTYPNVTLRLTKAGEATKATMTFGSAVLQTSATSKSTTGTAGSAFTWAKGVQDCTRYLGYYDPDGLIQHANPAGEIESSTLVLTYSDDTYSFTVSFDVPTITINNPL